MVHINNYPYLVQTQEMEVCQMLNSEVLGHFHIYASGASTSRGGRLWAKVEVQGKVAFGLRHICILSFSKKV